MTIVATLLLVNIALASQLAVAAPSPGDAFDHVSNAFVTADTQWIEVGFFTVLQDVWTTVEVTYTKFKDPVVFLSLPDVPGETSDDGASMAVRVNATKLTYVDDSTSSFEFQALSQNVNNSFCTFLDTFYTPADITLSPSFIGWLVAERGMFSLSDKRFIIH